VRKEEAAHPEGEAGGQKCHGSWFGMMGEVSCGVLTWTEGRGGAPAGHDRSPLEFGWCSFFGASLVPLGWFQSRPPDGLGCKSDGYMRGGTFPVSS
jgi:hypothetical protein